MNHLNPRDPFNNRDPFTNFDRQFEEHRQRVGVPYHLTGYCQECEHEWALGDVVVGLTLTKAGETCTSPTSDEAKRMVAKMLDGLESSLREAVRAELSPDDCTHEDADRALDALQRVLRATLRA